MKNSEQSTAIRTKPMQDVEWEAPIIAATLLDLSKSLKISPKNHYQDICKAMHVEVSGQNSGLGPVMLDACKRLNKRTKKLGIVPPINLLHEDGAPTDELLVWCLQTGMSLDDLFEWKPRL